MTLRVDALAARIPWLGAHSGYEQLVRHLPAAGATVHVTRCYTSPGQIRLGRAAAWWQGERWREDPVHVAGELRFALGARRRAIRHLLYGEVHHTFLTRWRKAPPTVVATLHHPPSQWGAWHPSLEVDLARLSSAIVLWSADLERFEALVGRGRVRFVRHGVDTDFFRPPAAPGNGPPRVVYAGQNGRDTATLRLMVERLAARRRDLRFDLVVRETIRTRDPELRRLAEHPNVDWHEGLSDEALRDLYGRAAVMALPLVTCGAVNTLLEGLACGLPVVTTDVGGVRDYGIESAVPPGDADAMLSVVEEYLDSPVRRHETGARARAFAERELAWPRIAAEHVAAYRALAAGSS